MTQVHPTKQRWYDNRQDMARSVEILLTFPEEIQTIVGEGIVLLAEQEFQANRIMQDYRTLGTQKVLGLYKSKNKKRCYDNNAAVHKGMNYLYVLSSENQDLLASKILELFSYLQDYILICTKNNVEPQTENVSNLTHTYIHLGSKEAAKFLQTLKHRFLESLQPEAVTDPSAYSKHKENILSDEQGMRLTKDST